MANAYSIQRNRQGWIDPTDQDFTLKALMFKQQKYDANQAKVQSVIEQYKSLQLARGVDRDYLNQRIKALVDNVNSFGAQDFSSNAVTNSIQYHIGQALDENVMTAMQETAKITAYQAEVAKIKEKNPELYNSLNEAYGLSPAQEYIQSDQVGDRIKGSLTYTPYKDIEGEVQKTLLDIQTKAKDGVVEYIDPANPGYKQVVTINGKSASELRQIALGMMGDKYNPQFTINTWGKYGGFKNIEGTSEQVNSYYDNLISAQNKDISEYQALISGGKLPENQIEEYKNKIKEIENQKLLTQNSKASFQKDPISGLVAMEKDNVAGRLGNSLGLLQTKSLKYDKNDVWFSEQNLKLETAKFEYTKEKDANDALTAARKWEDEKSLRLQEIALKAAGKSGDGSSSDGSGTGSGSSTYDTLVQGDGINQIEQTASGRHQQLIQGITEKRNSKNDLGKTIAQSIVNIANGTTKGVSSEQKAQAVQLLNQYKSKYGNLPPSVQMNEGQIDAFMGMYTRGDAYGALGFLPDISSEQSSSGEYGGITNLKALWSDKNNQYLMERKGFENARAAAQKEEKASGNPKHYMDNKAFQDYADRSLKKLSNNQNFSGTMDKAFIGELNRALTGLNYTNSPTAVENGGVTFQKVGKDKFAISYMYNSKDENKDAVPALSTPIVLTSEQVAKYFPKFAAKVNLGENRGVYTFQNMGMREIVSPRIGFLNPHDTYFKAHQNDAAKYIQGAPNDTTKQQMLSFLTQDGLKTMLSQATSPAANSPEDASKRQTLINVLTQNANRFVIIPQYVPSSNGSGSADAVLRLVDPESKRTILTYDLGSRPNLDNEMKLAEYHPQILYSQLIGMEVMKAMSGYQRGKFQLTEPLEYILKRSNVRFE